MTLGWSDHDGDGTRKVDPIHTFQAWLSEDDRQTAMWSGEIELSPEYFETLREHVVPLDSRAIADLRGSALALDIYAWLASRLCRISRAAGDLLSWAALRQQFGEEYATQKSFQQEFTRRLFHVGALYRAANFEVRAGPENLDRGISGVSA
jgi:Plasmid encoded RepA protein